MATRESHEDCKKQTKIPENERKERVSFAFHRDLRNFHQVLRSSHRKERTFSVSRQNSTLFSRLIRSQKQKIRSRTRIRNRISKFSGRKEAKANNKEARRKNHVVKTIYIRWFHDSSNIYIAADIYGVVNGPQFLCSCLFNSVNAVF